MRDRGHGRLTGRRRGGGGRLVAGRRPDGRHGHGHGAEESRRDWRRVGGCHGVHHGHGPATRRHGGRLGGCHGDRRGRGAAASRCDASHQSARCEARGGRHPGSRMRQSYYGCTLHLRHGCHGSCPASARHVRRRRFSSEGAGRAEARRGAISRRSCGRHCTRRASTRLILGRGLELGRTMSRRRGRRRSSGPGGRIPGRHTRGGTGQRRRLR